MTKNESTTIDNLMLKLSVTCLEDLQKTTTHGFAELSDTTIIVCEGVDASAFLQGQLTCDVNKLYTAGSALNPAGLGSCCTPQGKMVGLFYVAKITSEYYWLLVNKTNSPQILAHLKKYSIFSKVSLQESTENLLIYGIITPHESSPLQHRDPDIKVIPLGDPENRLYFYVAPTAPEMKGLGTKLTQNHWYLALLSQGIPFFDQNLSDKFLPSDLHIDELGGVSYKKGCYTGQEPIARLHYKGTPKFCCVLLHWPMVTKATSTLMDQGLADVTLDGKKIGSLVNVLELADTFLGLARIRIDSLNSVMNRYVQIPEWSQEAQLANFAYNKKRLLECMQGTDEDAETRTDY